MYFSEMPKKYLIISISIIIIKQFNTIGGKENPIKSSLLKLRSAKTIVQIILLTDSLVLNVDTLIPIQLNW